MVCLYTQCVARLPWHPLVPAHSHTSMARYRGDIERAKDFKLKQDDWVSNMIQPVLGASLGVPPRSETAKRGNTAIQWKAALWQPRTVGGHEPLNT